MNETRALFVDSMRAATDLLRAPSTHDRWSDPSVLASLTVGGLAGHLLRATTVVSVYLDRPEPSEPAIEPSVYYSDVTADRDLEGDLHVAVRRRGEKVAKYGPEALADEWNVATDKLAVRLAREPADRRIRAFRDYVLSLDGFLETRLVELAVHCDDLALSLGIQELRLPQGAINRAVELLLAVCRHRHDALSLLRALARRERDTADALRAM